MNILDSSWDVCLDSKLRWVAYIVWSSLGAVVKVLFISQSTEGWATWAFLLWPQLYPHCFSVPSCKIGPVFGRPGKKGKKVAWTPGCLWVPSPAPGKTPMSNICWVRFLWWLSMGLMFLPPQPKPYPYFTARYTHPHPHTHTRTHTHTHTLTNVLTITIITTLKCSYSHRIYNSTTSRVNETS